MLASKWWVMNSISIQVVRASLCAEHNGLLRTRGQLGGSNLGASYPLFCYCVDVSLITEWALAADLGSGGAVSETGKLPLSP